MYKRQPLDASVLYAMQFIISTPVEKLYTFVLAPQTQQDLTEILRRYRRRYEPHTFKSEAFLSLSFRELQ